MMREDLADVLKELCARNQGVPRPLRRPADADVESAERELGVRFHSDYRTFLLTTGGVVYGDVEPLTVVALTPRTDLVHKVRRCWEREGIPRSLLPFCEDNGNYFCLTESGQVVYWDHNGRNDEKWPNLASWIQRVWLDAG